MAENDESELFLPESGIRTEEGLYSLLLMSRVTDWDESKTATFADFVNDTNPAIVQGRHRIVSQLHIAREAEINNDAQKPPTEQTVPQQQDWQKGGQQLLRIRPSTISLINAKWVLEEIERTNREHELVVRNPETLLGLRRVAEVVDSARQSSTAGGTVDSSEIKGKRKAQAILSDEGMEKKDEGEIDTVPVAPVAHRPKNVKKRQRSPQPEEQLEKRVRRQTPPPSGSKFIRTPQETRTPPSPWELPGAIGRLPAGYNSVPPPCCGLPVSPIPPQDSFALIAPNNSPFSPRPNSGQSSPSDDVFGTYRPPGANGLGGSRDYSYNNRSTAKTPINGQSMFNTGLGSGSGSGMKPDQTLMGYPSYFNDKLRRSKYDGEIMVADSGSSSSGIGSAISGLGPRTGQRGGVLQNSPRPTTGTQAHLLNAGSSSQNTSTGSSAHGGEQPLRKPEVYTDRMTSLYENDQDIINNTCSIMPTPSFWEMMDHNARQRGASTSARGMTVTPTPGPSYIPAYHPGALCGPARAWPPGTSGTTTTQGTKPQVGASRTQASPPFSTTAIPTRARGPAPKVQTRPDPQIAAVRSGPGPSLHSPLSYPNPQVGSSRTDPLPGSTIAASQGLRRSDPGSFVTPSPNAASASRSRVSAGSPMSRKPTSAGNSTSSSLSNTDIIYPAESKKLIAKILSRTRRGRGRDSFSWNYCVHYNTSYGSENVSEIELKNLGLREYLDIYDAKYPRPTREDGMGRIVTKEVLLFAETKLLQGGKLEMVVKHPPGVSSAEALYGVNHPDQIDPEWKTLEEKKMKKRAEFHPAAKEKQRRQDELRRQHATELQRQQEARKQLILRQVREAQQRANLQAQSAAMQTQIQVPFQQHQQPQYTPYQGFGPYQQPYTQNTLGDGRPMVSLPQVPLHQQVQSAPIQWSQSSGQIRAVPPRQVLERDLFVTQQQQLLWMRQLQHQTRRHQINATIAPAQNPIGVVEQAAAAEDDSPAMALGMPTIP